MIKLMLVESPVKARKIYGILKHNDPQNTWEVEATVGHIIDLNHKTFSINMTTFEPEFIVTNQRQLSVILDKAGKCDEIYIASDDDREGEAIGQNVRNAIEKVHPGKPTYRLRFNEITKKSILQATANPSQFNDSLYQAQLTRRELDRIIGYKLCPILWKNVGRGLTAGRVQTCALMMLVDVELKRKAFTSQKFWYTKTTFEDGTIAKSEQFFDKAQAEDVYKKLEVAKVQYIEDTEDTIKKPAPPFNTSNLIQAASSILGMASEATMNAAQELFQNGLISYHRSTASGINPGFTVSAHKYLQGINADDAKDKPWIIPQSGAHEGIRPIDITVTPSSLTLKTDLINVYKLIWARVLATQAKPAVLRGQSVVLVDKDNNVLASGEGSKIIYDGHYRVGLNLFKPKIHTINPDKLQIKSHEIVESKTEPPRRWSEAEFIRHLEKVGVGRPSTYAATIATLMKNNYARRQGKMLIATMRGVFLTKYMYEWIPELTDTQFTAAMETELDAIEEGTHQRVPILKKYWTWFEPLLIKSKNYWLTTEDKCDKCGTVNEVWFSNAAPYLWCPGKDCDTCYSIDISPDWKIIRFNPGPYSEPCWNCKDLMTTKSGKYGIFAVCTKCGKTETIL